LLDASHQIIAPCVHCSWMGNKGFVPETPNVSSEAKS
jgi:hypothetical protein